MAQEFLDCSEVGSALEKVRRERMTEGMREGCRPVSDQVPDAPGIEGSTADPDPKSLARPGTG